MAQYHAYNIHELLETKWNGSPSISPSVTYVGTFRMLFLKKSHVCKLLIPILAVFIKKYRLWNHEKYGPICINSMFHLLFSNTNIHTKCKFINKTFENSILSIKPMLS